MDSEVCGRQGPKTAVNYACIGRHAVHTVFTDFAKAFDCIDHKVLVSLGLPDVTVRWICAFLRERQQHMKISDILSDWLQLSARMLQGSYLGPLTFVIRCAANGLFDA